VEFERVVPPSGTLGVAGKQLWLGPLRAGITITFWADHELIHLTIAGTRIKTVRAHLSTSPPSPRTAPDPPARHCCLQPHWAPHSRSTAPSAKPGCSPSATTACWPQRSSVTVAPASASTRPP
jgi:hypothetical protein